MKKYLSMTFVALACLFCVSCEDNYGSIEMQSMHEIISTEKDVYNIYRVTDDSYKIQRFVVRKSDTSIWIFEVTISCGSLVPNSLRGVRIFTPVGE